MKKKRALVLILEILCVLLIVGGVFFASGSLVKATPVYVFKSSLDVGDVVRISDVTTAEIPRGAINESFIRSKDEIVGKMVVTSVKKGDYILSNYLAEQGENNLTAADLAQMRKVSFAVKMDQALAGNLQRGDIVDLLYTGAGQNALTGETFTYSDIFMQGIYVWAVSTSDGYPYAGKDGSFNDETSFSGTQEVSMNANTSGDYGELSIVTVAVSGSQAEEIATRSSSGVIQILGRFANGENVKSSGFVINSYNPVYAGNENPENM